MAAAGVSGGLGAPAVIEVAGLVRSYDGRPVLRGISFRVAAGETFALIGPNGAGKTTTIEILEGFRAADGGTVRVLGTDPSRGGREHRARVGIQLQVGGIDPRLTAREVLGLHARFHAAPRGVAALLERVGLAGVAGTRYRRLSGGERQRLGLALAIVGQPRVVLLDEPTAGLDVEARGLVREVLSELRRDGLTVLLTSHDLADVERVADRLAILDRGRIVAQGTPAEIVGGGGGVRLRLAEALPDAERAALAAQLGVAEVVDEGGGQHRIEVAPTPAVVAAIAAWCAERGLLVLELRAGGGTLEERYLELVGGPDAGPDTGAGAGETP